MISFIRRLINRTTFRNSNCYKSICLVVLIVLIQQAAASSANTSGTVTQSGGTLTAQNISIGDNVGYNEDSVFIQEGDIFIGSSAIGETKLELYSYAQLDFEGGIHVGYIGNATMTQKEHSSVSSKSLYLGSSDYSGTGKYVLEDNSKLNVDVFRIGGQGTGELDIKSSDAQITVNEIITFSDRSKISCVNGSSININNGGVSVSSSTPANLSDFNKLTLRFSGSENNLEAPSQDLGAFMENPNYLFNQIAFSGEGTVKLSLQDNYNNDLTSDEFLEAVYTNDILIGENIDAILDLNGLSMYTKAISLDEDSTITIQDGNLVVVTDENTIISLSGTYTYDDYTQSLKSAAVPEPSVILLFLFGAGYIYRVTRRV